jgi:hypothetical protein
MVAVSVKYSYKGLFMLLPIREAIFPGIKKVPATRHFVI